MGPPTTKPGKSQNTTQAKYTTKVQDTKQDSPDSIMSSIDMSSTDFKESIDDRQKKLTDILTEVL